jgi:hypothetical protein
LRAALQTLALTQLGERITKILRSQRVREALVYAIVALAIAIVAVVSLRRDGYLAAGDVYPGYVMPGNHVFAESTKLWGDHVISGLGSPHFMPGAVPLALWGGLWGALGLGGPTAQWLLYLALLEFAGLGAVFFARTLFPERRLIALTTGLAYPLSFYLGLSFLNQVTTFAFGFFPFAAALLMRRVRQPVSNLRLALDVGLASLGFMILATTPPIAVYALLWCLAWLIGSLIRWGTWRIWPGLALGATAAVMLNAWWAYAAFVTLYASGGAAMQTFVSPLAWSFVDQHASILNMLSMQGLWSYPVLGYFPWAGAYASGFRLVALYIPAAFAAVAVLLAPYRGRVWLLTALCAVSLFIGKGYHQPFGDVNAFLYAKVPFFWLLRDPQEATGITLYLSMFVLAGVGATQLAILAGNAVGAMRPDPRNADRATVAAWALLTALLLCNGLAFIRGDVISETWLNGAAKTVIMPPLYWRQASDFLNAQPDDARVLILPNDDFYAMPYTWGYYGLDLVPQTWIARPVVIAAPAPSTWISGSPPLREQYGHLIDEMRAGSSRPIAPILSALDAGWILQRNDVAWSSPGRHILSPAVIGAYLARQPGIRKVATFGSLDVYRVTVSHACASAYDGFVRVPDGNDIDLVRAFDWAGGEVPLVTGGDAPAMERAFSSAVETAKIQPLPATCAPRDSATYDVDLTPGTKMLVLHASYSPDWRVEGNGRDLAWRHVIVDNFLNGWLVPDAAAGHVSLYYGPARPFRVLQTLAVITLCCLVLGLALSIVMDRKVSGLRTNAASDV